MRNAAWCGLVCVLLAGCAVMASTGYYWQGAAGQLDILARAQPIDDVIAHGDDAALAVRLARAKDIRAYASRELGLPDNRSFTRYSDLKRPYVVWNVFAAPPLSLTAQQWCFPVAGCVSYRGYFDEAEARAEAARLAAAGEDVHVNGVPAYSTLGYFDDPILSTFVRWPETELARLMFHELAHQIVYVRDDSVFNESFAVAVEEAGLKRWLAAEGNPQLDAQFARAERLRVIFRDLVQATRERLKAVYAGSASDAEKLAEKHAAFAAMREAYERARVGNSAMAGYDRWFAGYDNQGPNNASLSSVALYTAQVPAFRALLAEEGDSLPRFYARVKDIAVLPKVERNAVLAHAAEGAKAPVLTLSH
jgi:predicted aminopeptidase